MHGVIIPSFRYDWFPFKAILPERDGVITSFYCPVLIFNSEFRGCFSEYKFLTRV